jgi:transcription initiation factor TFIIB
MVDKMSAKLQCECGNTEIITDPATGEQICTACGTVLNEKILDHGPEWRAFNPEQTESLTRVGAPLTPLIHDNGLSTTISWKSQDATGRSLTQDERQRQFRLRKWQRRTSASDSTQRNLTQALSELTRIADELNLPQNTRETAAMIYRKAVKEGLIKGRTIQSVVASAIYMACRQCQVIRSLDDIARAATITRKEAARNYRHLYKQLQPEVPPVDKDNLITKYVNLLRIGGQTEQLCRRIMDQASEQRLTIGRAPEGITAAALYISCKINQEDRTQGEIAKAAQITEVTIRNRYKELLKKIDFEVNL